MEKEDKAKTSFELLHGQKDEPSKTIKEGATEEALKQIFTKDNIEMKTDLSAQLILAMSRGLIFSDKYEVGNEVDKVMYNFIKNIQVLSVSKGRKGRQEFVALIRNSQEVPDNTEFSVMSRLFNK